MKLKKILVLIGGTFLGISLLNAVNLEIIKTAGNLPNSVVAGLSDNESAALDSTLTPELTPEPTAAEIRSNYFNQIGLLNATPVHISEEESGVYVGQDAQGNKMFAFYPAIEIPQDSIMGEDDADKIINNVAKAYGSSTDSYITEAAKNFIDAVKDLKSSDFKSWSELGSACSSAGLSRVKFRSPGSLSNTCTNPSYPNTTLCTGDSFSGIDSSLGYGCAS